MVKMIKRIREVIDIGTDFVWGILLCRCFNTSIVLGKRHHQLLLTVVHRRLDIHAHCFQITAVFGKLRKD